MKPLGVPTPGSLSGCRLQEACLGRRSTLGRRDPRRFLLSLFSPFPILDNGFSPSMVLSFSLSCVDPQSLLLSLPFVFPAPLAFSSVLLFNCVSPSSPMLPQRRMRRRKEISNPFITRSSESSWGSRIPPKSSADREKGLRSFSSPRPVVARCGPLYYFLKERSNIFGHLGHLGHFEKCQACLHMTMEVTSNLEVILKVIFV